MRHKLPVLLFFFISFSLLAITFSFVYAASDKVIVLGTNEVVNEDYFAAGDRVVVSGVVNGDVYAAAGEVLIDGAVNGDVIAAGGKITIRGSVTQNVRVAGGNIDISGDIGRNVTVAGGNITLSDSAIVSGSLVVLGGDVSVYAPIGKGIHAGAGNLTLSSTVGGNILAGVGNLTLTQGSLVQGNLEYYSEEEAIIPDTSVTGRTIRNEPPVEYRNRGGGREEMQRFAFGWKIISLTGAFIIGLLLLKFAPGVSEEVVLQIRAYPWRNLGIGFAALIIVPIANIILMMTLFGIPLAFIAFAVYFVLIYLAGIYVSMFVGRYILTYFKKKTRQEFSLLLGVFVYGLITMIPVLGWFVSFVSMLVALGALVVAERRLHAGGVLRKG